MDQPQSLGGADVPDPAGGPLERATLIGTLAHLWPYIWPGDRFDLKMRVVSSMVLLLAAKLITLTVPFSFKWATDALTGANTAPVQADNWQLWVIASPLLLTASYGAMRIVMAVLTQWRDGIFARVAMHAVRKLATITFIHMHELSLRFHLERKTGGLTRVLERGREGIEVIVRMVILQLIPTIVEVSLLLAVLLWQFDWRYVLATLITVAVYMYYTYIATEWRIGIRRKMNDSDTEANTKAIDSLLNYETVKYFSAEAREAQRYDRSVARYEESSVHAYTSLAVLNTGQAVIFTLGLTATMLMCAIGVRNGTNTVGDFVLVNAMMIQLYQPLNFMGMVYREIKQAIIDIEKMFNVLGREAEIKDMPDAQPLLVTTGHLRFEDVRFAYEPARPILKGISFEVPAGKTVAIVGPSGAGQVDHLAAPVPSLRHLRRKDFDRRPGHPRGHAGQLARLHRHGAARYRAVQRHHPLQHPLWPLGRQRCRGRAGGTAGADRSFHPHGSKGLRNPGRRARLETVRRREAARRHRAHRSEGAADPGAGRGHLCARHPHRARDPGRARPGGEKPHLAGDRAPPFHHRRRRRGHCAGPGPDRRTRHPRRFAGAGRPLCQHVEQAARGGGCARETGSDRRQQRGAEPGAAAGRRRPHNARGRGVSLSPVPTLA
ncbi:hypothetical protein ACVWXO_009264 [Bradyrhizobium sp. LM2.7]